MGAKSLAAGTLSAAPLLQTPALLLPICPEPLVEAFSTIGMPSQSRSKYPAKKSKRAKTKPLPPTSVRGDAAHCREQPLAWAEIAAWRVPDADDFASTLLDVRRIAQGEQCLDPIAEALTLACTLAADALFDLFDDDHEHTALPSLPQLDDMAAVAPSTLVLSNEPLPRSAAVTPWRKTGPLDSITYWLRKSSRNLAVMMRFGRAPRELAALRAENEWLRWQLKLRDAIQP